jgi:hypothetical protein
MQDSIRQIVFGRVLSQLRGCFCATPYNSPCLVRSFVLILTRDNGSEPKKVCMRCDEGHLRGRKSGFSLLLSRLKLRDRLSAPPYRLSDGCIVPAATEMGDN